MLVHASVSKDSNSPQHGTCCSPARCVCVDERQPSWCFGSSRFTTGTRCGHWRSGLGEGGVLSCCWFLPVTLCKGKQVWGHSPEAVSSHHLWIWVFLFLPQKTVNFGREKISLSTIQAALYCLNKANPFKLLLRIFTSIFGTCRRTSYFLLKDLKMD